MLIIKKSSPHSHCFFKSSIFIRGYQGANHKPLQQICIGSVEDGAMHVQEIHGACVQ